MWYAYFSLHQLRELLSHCQHIFFQNSDLLSQIILPNRICQRIDETGRTTGAAKALIQTNVCFRKGTAGDEFLAVN